MAVKTGFCVGCLRTLAEAREWKKMNDFRRHQIINDRSRREKKIEREATSMRTKEAT
jgi:predicted Fe-S protein YdhL (DUF1289 family)